MPPEVAKVCMRRFFTSLLFVLAHPADEATLYLQCLQRAYFLVERPLRSIQRADQAHGIARRCALREQVLQAKGTRNRATMAPQADAFERGQYCARPINERRSIEATRSGSARGHDPDSNARWPSTLAFDSLDVSFCH